MHLMTRKGTTKFSYQIYEVVTRFHMGNEKKLILKSENIKSPTVRSTSFRNWRRPPIQKDELQVFGFCRPHR